MSDMTIAFFVVLWLIMIGMRLIILWRAAVEDARQWKTWHDTMRDARDRLERELAAKEQEIAALKAQIADVRQIVNGGDA